MHTVALASNGVLLSWGNNDDGALGREGPENTPLRVDGALNVPVNGVAVGDCHTVAYNTQTNQVFFWGCYKVSDDAEIGATFSLDNSSYFTSFDLSLVSIIFVEATAKISELLQNAINFHPLRSPDRLRSQLQVGAVNGYLRGRGTQVWLWIRS